MGDLGGIHALAVSILTLFLVPIAKHSFIMKAINKMYLIKVSD